MTDIIELNGLSKRYGRRRGIEGLTFSVTEGEIFGFIGPSGAGKTTTSRLMLDLLRPTAGSIRIFGKDHHRHGASIRKEIGYLPSEIYFYDHMRVKDAIDYAAGFYHGHNTKKRIRELAEYFELDLRLPVDELSRANRKKTAIIQALLHSPKLLILDDPTAGLDQEMQYRLTELLRATQESGATIFLASPVLGLAQRLCQRVALVREGQILDTVTAESLRKNTYQKIRAAADYQVQELDLPGVSDFFSTANHLEFLYRGNTKQLLHALSQLPLHNVYIEEPDLDDVFYYYYGESGAKKDFWRDQTERDFDPAAITPLKQQQREQQVAAQPQPAPQQPVPAASSKPQTAPTTPAQPAAQAKPATTKAAPAPPKQQPQQTPPAAAKPTTPTDAEEATAPAIIPATAVVPEQDSTLTPQQEASSAAEAAETADAPVPEQAATLAGAQAETEKEAPTAPMTEATTPPETAEDDGFVERILEEQKQKREATQQAADAPPEEEKPAASAKKPRKSKPKDGDA